VGMSFRPCRLPFRLALLSRSYPGLPRVKQKKISLILASKKNIFIEMVRDELP
jgi:hypothetical protein